MATPNADRIAKLKAQQEKLAARVAKIQAVETAKARKLAMRRKIIVGGAVLAALDADPFLAMRVRAVLASIEREADREAIADLLRGSGALNGSPATPATRPAAVSDILSADWPSRNPATDSRQVAPVLDDSVPMPPPLR